MYSILQVRTFRRLNYFYECMSFNLLKNMPLLKNKCSTELWAVSTKCHVNLYGWILLLSSQTIAHLLWAFKKKSHFSSHRNTSLLYTQCPGKVIARVYMFFCSHILIDTINMFCEVWLKACHCGLWFILPHGSIIKRMLSVQFYFKN